MEGGAAGVEHCGKCSLHSGIQRKRSALMWLGWWFLSAMLVTYLGWWTDFKTDFSGLSFFPFLRQDLRTAESSVNLARLKTRNRTCRSFLWIQVWRLLGCLQKPCQPSSCSGSLCPRPTHQSNRHQILRLFSQVWTIPGTFPSLNTKYLLQVVLRVEELKCWAQKQNTLFHIVWIPILLIATLIPEQGVLAMKYQIQPLLCQYAFCLGTLQNACSFPFFYFKFAMPDYVVNTSIGTIPRKWKNSDHLPVCSCLEKHPGSGFENNLYISFNNCYQNPIWTLM